MAIKHSGKGKIFGFAGIDASLPWDQIQKVAEGRLCTLCDAEEAGTCLIKNGLTPLNKECNIDNQTFERWKNGRVEG